MIYRFRVTLEDHEDIYRDIDIKVNQNFHDLHFAIQQAISFDNSKAASFFISDDYWRKGEEITIGTGGNEKEKKNKTKKDTNQANPDKKKVLADYVNDPHQKFVYVFDPEKKWVFNVELIKILPDESNIQYPKCVKSIGNSPKQYKETALPPPPVEEDETPKHEKEELLLVPENTISEDDDTDVIIPLDEEEEIGENIENGEPPEGEEPATGDEDDIL